MSDIDLGSSSVTPSLIQTNELAKPSDFKQTSGWINTVPLSNSTATLSRKSAKSRRVPLADNFVKSYLKKRNLILDLLVSKFSGPYYLEYFHTFLLYNTSAVYYCFLKDKFLTTRIRRNVLADAETDLCC